MISLDRAAELAQKYVDEDPLNAFGLLGCGLVCWRRLEKAARP
ncbi:MULTISPECIES: hypothetical protein [unclassified Streptomyces]